MKFWDYRQLPDRVKWCLFISSISSIILANAGAITLSAITSHPDPDGIIATTLIALSSAIAHTLQVMSNPPRSSEFPHVRKVLVAFLVVASIAHTVFIVYLRSTHDEFFDTLSKLVCIFHGVFAENITKIWSYLHQGWIHPRCFDNLVVYLLMAIQLAFFVLGVWALLGHNLQVVWCVCAIPLWIVTRIFLLAFFTFRKNRKGPEPLTDDYYIVNQMRWLACISGLAAFASTVLPCLPFVWRWKLLFYLEYAFVECMTSWSFISPFIIALRNIIKKNQLRRAIRRAIKRGEKPPDVESAMSMATFTTVSFNTGALSQGSPSKVGQSFEMDS